LSYGKAQQGAGRIFRGISLAWLGFSIKGSEYKFAILSQL